MGHGFFGFSPQDIARLSNIFGNLHRQDSCLTVNNIWVFHPGGGGGGGGGVGIYPNLLRPKHVIYHFDQFTHPCVSTLDFVPFFELMIHSPTPVNTQYHAPTPDSTRCDRAYEMHDANAFSFMLHVYMSAT